MISTAVICCVLASFKLVFELPDDSKIVGRDM